MPRLPKVAIVGRPNVGKSALFNRICRRRHSIVDEAEGVTRDRLYAEADCFGVPFELIDTGGIHAKSKALYNDEIKRQAEIAIEEADSIILVVDGQVGLTDLDLDVARILKRTHKPLCVAVNKVDDPQQELLIHDFHSLGIKNMMGVSATHGWQIAELLEEAIRPIPVIEEEDVRKGPKVALLGRPNVGKSTLVNTLVHEDRCVVSPVAGTTRDSVDIPFAWEGKDYTLVDTAGIRRKRAEHEVVDKFAAIRTQRALEHCDIVLLMIDSQEGMTSQEKKIARSIELSGKPCILIFNKWDLVKNTRMEHCLKVIRDEASFLNHCPALFMSALNGRNIDKIFQLVDTVYEQSQRRIGTGALNSFMEQAIQRCHPPMITGKRLKIYYLTQVSVAPPRFLLFVNNPDLMTDTYKRYLMNQFRQEFGFTGCPLSFQLKGKKRTPKEEFISA